MIQQWELARLRAFHAAHFAGQPIPNLSTRPQNLADQNESSHSADIINDNHDDGGLGFYEDGVKRTLTDEQIKMFRHSEIQRLLGERRAAKAKEETKTGMKEGSSRVTHEPRKRRFQDEPATTHSNVDILTYDDDEPEAPAASMSAEKKFLWPVLGQNVK